MDAPILSQADIDFLLHDWLKVEELTKRSKFADHSRETFDAMLEVSRSIAETHFRPHYRKSDTHEPTFDGHTVSIIDEVEPALDAFADTGLLAAAFGEEHGGINLPFVVHRACFAWLQAANISTAAYPMLTMGNANLILAHGTPEQIATYVEPELDGRFFGTMCLSEPHAGSSLADVKTKAVPASGGAYRLSGQKMWISGGEHELSENIVHLVLARAEGSPSGVKGLSLFIVPKYLVNADGSLGEHNDVTLSGLNHKMGYRGTTNTLLNFGEGAHTPGGEAGAIGYLVGEVNRGLQYMFHMMNEARVGVGAGAAALGMTGYLQSLDYARNRPQGRPVGAKDPDAPQVMLTEHADVRRMLLAQKAYAEGAMALCLYAAKLVDEADTAGGEDAANAALLLDVLTPIVKSWPSQYGPVANDLAIQVLGGSGYTRDYDVEQFYRDNRLNPIHEGTHGIQAQDLLGRKVIMSGGSGLALLARTIGDAIAAAGGEFADFAEALQARLDRLVEVTANVWSTADPETALANATPYLEAAGHIVVAWIWLDTARAAAESGSALAAGKRAAAEYFFTYELPRVDAMLNLVDGRSKFLVDLDPAVL